jgi:hypothetical protein
MNTTYKLSNDFQGNPCCVMRSDGVCIPFHPDNKDYQKYLQWVAEGNTPEPADSGE